MPDPLDGKVVVITGAANGIGRALAHGFSRQGARVALCDVDEQGLAKVESELAGAGRHRAYALDVTDGARAEAVMHAIDTELGGIDVLVNNAGISHHSLAWETSREVLERVMGVNFHGAVNCTLAALPSLVRRRGVIAVMSSVAGFAPLYQRSAYAASKHALHGWFESLRSELEPRDVAVLMVCPGFVDTGIDRRALAGDGGPAAPGKPVVGKLARPDEVADQIVGAVARRRRRLMPTTVAKLAWWVSRIAPRAYERQMLRTQRR